MAIPTLLKILGGGMGTMALLNEEKGGTFTSYPEESRLKQLGKKLYGSKAKRMNDPKTYSGSGQNIYGQQYGDQLGAGITENRDGVNEMFAGFDTSDAMSMANQNIEKWVNAKIDPSSAQWLGLIDTVYERQSELEKDPELARQFSTMLEAMNVNYLDANLEHHNQRRQKAGFDPIRVQQDAPEYNENVRR